MGRPEQPIDPARGPLQQFALGLRELRALKPGNTYRALAERAHYSPSTLARAAGGREPPSLEVVTAYVAACGGDVDLWTKRWRRLQRELGADVVAERPERPSPLPYQLPAEPPDFAGRRTEIEQLYAEAVGGLHEADRASPTVLGITGGPGLGKTALAIRLAHQLAPEFPDGQLFVNLHGFDERRLEPETVLRQCVRALGHPDERIPTDPDELACAYRSLLRRRRVLLVFDNARCAADLRPLLPGTASCLMLATSRSNLVGLQANRVLRLEPLSPDESADLLGRTAGSERVRAEPEAAAELAELCGRFPLALRIAGARLASRPKWRVATLTERLRDERSRLHELAAGDLRVVEAFSMSYRALEELERLVFRRLGALYPGTDFTPEVAALLADVDAHAAEERLENLVDVNLLQSDVPGRYQMHDLLRLYASSCWRAEDTVDDSARRMLSWYVDTASAATRLLIPNWFVIEVAADSGRAMSTRPEAMSWFERERHNISALVRFANETGEHDLAWRLAYAAGGYFMLRRHWRSYAATHELALGSARQLGDDAVCAAIQVNLGTAYAELGRTEDALELQSKAVGHFNCGGDVAELVHALNSLSHTCIRHGRLGEALEHARRAHDLARRNGHVWGQGTSQCTIGRAYADQGRFELALEMFRAAHERSLEMGSRWAQMRSLQIIADTCRQMGEATRAAVHYRAAIDLAVEIGDRHSEGRLILSLGEVHSELGEHAEAGELWCRASRVLEAIGDPLAAAPRRRLARDP